MDDAPVVAVRDDAGEFADQGGGAGLGVGPALGDLVEELAPGAELLFFELRFGFCFCFC